MTSLLWVLGPTLCDDVCREVKNSAKDCVRLFMAKQVNSPVIPPGDSPGNFPRKGLVGLVLGLV